MRDLALSWDPSNSISTIWTVKCLTRAVRLTAGNLWLESIVTEGRKRPLNLNFNFPHKILLKYPKPTMLRRQRSSGRETLAKVID